MILEFCTELHVLSKCITFVVKTCAGDCTASATLNLHRCAPRELPLHNETHFINGMPVHDTACKAHTFRFDCIGIE